MKSKKILKICIFAGIISCSYCLTASAGSFSDVSILKDGLLACDNGISSFNIMDYNTNNDNVVNVLDLCRAKKAVIDRYQVTNQKVSVELSGPWISDDRSKITVPVKIKGNRLGISGISFDIKYNDWYYSLSDVYASSKGSVSFSKETGGVLYTAPGGKNLISEGIFVYLVFSPADYVPEAMYNIRLNNIQATMLENNSVRELTADECSVSAKLSFSYGYEMPSEVSTSVSGTTTVHSETDVPVTTTDKPVTTVKIEPSKQDVMYFELNSAEMSYDGKRLRIPVYMDMNVKGIGSFNSIVKYDRNRFKLTSVDNGDFDGYGYVGGNSDNAVFNMNNGKNIEQRSGNIAWLNFEINGEIDSKEYTFELTDIKVLYYENWNQKQVDNYKNKSDVYKFKLYSEDKPIETTVSSAVTFAEITTFSETSPSETEPPVETTKPNSAETTSPSGNDYVLNAEQMWFVDKVNEYRKQNGKPQIKCINRAFKAAEERARMLSEVFKEDLPDGRNYKWVLYDNDVMPYCSSQHIDNLSETKEQAWDTYIKGSSQFLLDDSMFDRFAVGHYVDSNGRNYWAMLTFG